MWFGNGILMLLMVLTIAGTGVRGGREQGAASSYWPFLPDTFCRLMLLQEERE